MEDFEAFIDTLFDAPVQMRTMFDNTLRVFSDGRVERLLETGDWREVPHTPNLNGKYNTIGVNGKMYKRNKLVAACFLNHPLENKLPVDHINGVFLDDRVENLRSSTHKDNSQNTDSKCYYWHKKNQKWFVNLKIDGKQNYFGSFINEKDAAARALEMKLLHFESFRARHEYNLAHGL
tara:strand:- start:231 stop:764 length:534 start_codon:yes stop_codon:yes gene_type:complete